MRALALLLVLATPAPAATRHCPGAPPGLMPTLSGGTAGGPRPVHPGRETCRIFGPDLPFAVELGIPTDKGRSPVRGCCREIAE